MTSLTRNENFKEQVRRALQHLYDPREMRRSLLPEILGLKGTLDKVAALRKIFQDAIHALKPDEKTPPESNAWRIYEILTYRFIEQSSQKEVAADMALSIRQLQRLEGAAIDTLAVFMADHYQVDFSGEEPPLSSALVVKSASLTDDVPDASTNLTSFSEIERELDWLKKSSPRQEIHLPELVKTVLKTLSPLIASLQTTIQVEIANDLPLIAGHLTILRQSLFNILAVAIQHTAPHLQGVSALRDAPRPTKRLILSAHMEGEKVHLLIWVESQDDLDQEQPSVHPDSGKEHSLSSAGYASSDSENEKIIELVRKLVTLSDGTLEIRVSDAVRPFQAQLTLPVVQRIPVMVVDDNADTLHLLERYLAGSHYQFFGIQDPSQVIALVSDYKPRIIVLDVMMPGIDGWDLLGRLKQHPATQKTAIIISTVIPQESLALMLGADGFLHKPFSQEDFLAALDQQIAHAVHKERNVTEPE